MKDQVRRALRASAGPLADYFDVRFRDLHLHVDHRIGELTRTVEKQFTSLVIDLSARLEAVRAEVESTGAAVREQVERQGDGLRTQLEAQARRLAEIEERLTADVRTANELSALAERSVRAIEERLDDGDHRGRTP